MVRVLVMANDSLLADAIMSDLARETTLDVLRIRLHESSTFGQAIPEDCSILIFVEDEATMDAFMEARSLLRDQGCFRVIMISSGKSNLQVYDRYEMPVSGMAQVIRLAKYFDREIQVRQQDDR